MIGARDWISDVKDAVFSGDRVVILAANTPRLRHLRDIVGACVPEEALSAKKDKLIYPSGAEVHFVVASDSCLRGCGRTIGLLLLDEGWTSDIRAAARPALREGGRIGAIV